MTLLESLYKRGFAQLHFKQKLWNLLSKPRLVLNDFVLISWQRRICTSTCLDTQTVDVIRRIPTLPRLDWQIVRIPHNSFNSFILNLSFLSLFYFYFFLIWSTLEQQYFFFHQQYKTVQN